LLPIDVGVVVVTILLLCPKKRFSYAPPNPKNLQNRFTTNPLNEIATQLPIKALLTKMKLNPLSFFLETLDCKFFPFASLSFFPLFAQC
jgi:hypothetical protein